MTTSRDLRELAVQALLADNATAAGQNVYSPRTWPTWDGSYPVLLAQTPKEDGESWGRNGSPAFTVTTTLRVVGRCQTAAQADDQGAVVVLEQLEELRMQVKAALINYPPLMAQLQQFSFFRSEIQTSGDGERPIGEIVIDIGLEFVQTAEDFYPVPTVPLTGVDVRIQEPDGTTVPGLTIDLPQ